MKRVKLTFDRALLKEAVQTQRVREADAMSAARRGDYKPVRIWFARALYSVLLDKMKRRWLSPFVWYRRAKNKRIDWDDAFNKTLIELNVTPLELEL